MTLCEYVMEVSEEEARKRINDDLLQLICDISDEIIATAAECDPEDVNGS